MAKKPKSLKSSEVLQSALEMVMDGRQTFACAAIGRVELDTSDEMGGVPVKSNAMQIMLQFKPEKIKDDMKMTQPWWDKGASERIVAMQSAIEIAKKRGD